MARTSEKRKRKVASMERAVQTRKTGGGGPIKLPSGVKWFVKKNRDDFTFDIIPYTISDGIKDFHPDVVFAEAGDLYPEQTYWLHYNVGPDERRVICSQKTFGKKCYICEYRTEMIQDPKHDKKSADALKSKQRQLWCVRDLDKPKEGLLIWDESYHNFGVNIEEKIKKARPEKKKAYAAFFDPDDGFSMRITAKEKTTGDRIYNEYLIDEMIPREEKLSSKLLDTVPCLNDLIVCPKYKEVKELFLQTGDNDDEDDEEKDEADDTDEEEEEEDKKPKKKDKKSKSKKDEDDEDEEEDDDEEEDEEEDEGDEEEADEEDGDDEGDEDEGEEVELEKGSTVTFKHKKKELSGVITKIDKKTDIAQVKVEGIVKPISVPLDDLTADEEEDQDDEENDEDDKPVKKGKKSSKSKKDEEEEADEDDDEDEDEDDEDEDDEEEPLEEDDDDDDDDDEDEPKKPKGKKK